MNNEEAVDTEDDINHESFSGTIGYVPSEHEEEEEEIFMHDNEEFPIKEHESYASEGSEVTGLTHGLLNILYMQGNSVKWRDFTAKRHHLREWVELRGVWYRLKHEFGSKTTIVNGKEYEERPTYPRVFEKPSFPKISSESSIIPRFRGNRKRGESQDAPMEVDEPDMTKLRRRK